jgi:hypothetical protein
VRRREGCLLIKWIYVNLDMLRCVSKDTTQVLFNAIALSVLALSALSVLALSVLALSVLALALSWFWRFGSYSCP